MLNKKIIESYEQYSFVTILGIVYGDQSFNQWMDSHGDTDATIYDFLDALYTSLVAEALIWKA